MAWVHAVLDAPTDRHDELARFWSGVLGWPAGEAWPDHPELSSFEPPVGSPYLHLQRVAGPARVHLDLESEDPDELARGALGLGATPVSEHDHWRSLRSPGGLPFCVLHAARHDPPEPTTWPDGHHSRMVQVCIDAPVAAYEEEVRFWRSLLHGRWAASSAPEFAGKWHDDEGSPLQLLFQRLEEPHGDVRAHLDHGTDDLAAEVRRVRDLGAGEIGAGRGWHALRDPAGSPFCVTLNSPAYTLRRHLA